MSVFTCKMCGGTLEITGNETIATCEYCGTKQTLPKMDSDRKVNLYKRANHFRRNNEYDKAEGLYEQILNEDSSDAEAYWSLVLCRYGIEYVEEKPTGKRIPTVHRAQFTSILADEDYKSALLYADLLQKEVYEAEAKAIDDIQKGILAISQKEEPFDVFICYKETDANGRRTQDSVLANELYHQLTQEGFKVFFSRITLEDVLGTAYEPYIFAALHSAKVMVVLGTRQEYFNAVWVKNEWSRYLAMIRSGEKKALIPAYRDMDPYDLPEEFSHLQAQDMSKLGFMQDLLRGIKKLVGQEEAPKSRSDASAHDKEAELTALLRRIHIFLEGEDWNSADIYCEKALDIDPENPEAHVCKLLAQLKLPSIEALETCKTLPEKCPAYRNAVRFADPETAEHLVACNQTIKEQQDPDDLTPPANASFTVKRLYRRKKQLTESLIMHDAYIKHASMLRKLSSILLILSIVVFLLFIAFMNEVNARSEPPYRSSIQSASTDEAEEDTTSLAFIAVLGLTAYAASVYCIWKINHLMYRSAGDLIPQKSANGNLAAIVIVAALLPPFVGIATSIAVLYAVKYPSSVRANGYVQLAKVNAAIQKKEQSASR